MTPLLKMHSSYDATIADIKNKCKLCTWRVE